MKHLKEFGSLNEAAKRPEAAYIKDLQEVEKAPKKLGVRKEKKYNKTEKDFIGHMESFMDWNSGRLRKYVNQDHFEYDCMEGSSVVRELKDAAKKFGVKIDVEKCTNDSYNIWVVNKEAKVSKEKDDYSEAIFKMDKWMPDFDEDTDKEFKKAQKSVKALADYFENNADEERLASYVNVGENGIDWKELAKQYLK